MLEPGERFQTAKQLFLGRNFRLCGAQVESELSTAGENHKNTIWALLLSLLELITIMVTPNEMVGHYCRDYSLSDPQPFFSGLSLVLGSYKQRQFIWHQADLSAMILVLGRSQRQREVQPCACKLNTENIYDAKVIRLLGSSSPVMIGVQVVSGRNFLGHISKHLKLVCLFFFQFCLFLDIFLVIIKSAFQSEQTS